MAPLTGFPTAVMTTMTTEAHTRLEQLHRQATHDAIAAASRKRSLARALRSFAARLESATPTGDVRTTARPSATTSMEVPA